MKTLLTILIIGATAASVQAGPIKRSVKRDIIENRIDHREDVRDRLEDVRDARHNGGVLDKLEDRVDRAEDKFDRRENKFDRRHIGLVSKRHLWRPCRKR